MAFPTSTIASIIIGATAITGSALAVNISSAPARNDVTNSVVQPETSNPPLVAPEPSSPAATVPISPTPVPTQTPIIPPPVFNGDDDDNYEDEDDEDEDEDEWEHEDYEDEEEWED